MVANWRSQWCWSTPCSAQRRLRISLQWDTGELMVRAEWESRELDSQRPIRDDRAERVRPGLGRRLAQLVLAALVLALPAEVVFGLPVGTGVRYALGWLTLAGGGILLVRAGSRSSSRDWLAHRSWMAGLLVVVMLVFSAGVLSGSLPLPPNDTA